jgi:hypothetical protein
MSVISCMHGTTTLHNVRCATLRVETKMHFSVFAKMRKSCENGSIFAKFHEISFRENFSFSRKFSRKSQKNFAKIENPDFRENFTRKFSRKSRNFFAKMFAKTENGYFRESFCENLVIFSRKFSRNLKTAVFAKILSIFRENFRDNEKL